MLLLCLLVLTPQVLELSFGQVLEKTGMVLECMAPLEIIMLIQVLLINSTVVVQLMHPSVALLHPSTPMSLVAATLSLLDL